MNIPLPIILPRKPFEEQVRFLWERSLIFSTPLGADTVIVAVSGTQGVKSLVAHAGTNTHAFRRVPDFMDLADFDQWLVSFPVFMRLACLYHYLDAVKANCNCRLLKNEKNLPNLYWTYWLHAQGIPHYEYLTT